MQAKRLVDFSSADARMEAAAIAHRQHDIEESMSALAYYKTQNEDALRRALAKDKAVRSQTKFTSSEAIKRERIEWLQRIVDEESTKPLQVPPDSPTPLPPNPVPQPC